MHTMHFLYIYIYIYMRNMFVTIYIDVSLTLRFVMRFWVCSRGASGLRAVKKAKEKISAPSRRRSKLRARAPFQRLP